MKQVETKDKNLRQKNRGSKISQSIENLKSILSTLLPGVELKKLGKFYILKKERIK